MNAKIVRVDDLEQIDIAGVHWRPLRKAIGVTAFKTNAYSAAAGERLIEEHTEKSSGQEEMYIVISGAATFDVDDEQVDVAAGAVIFYADPATKRGAVADQDNTIAIAIGNAAGAAGPVSTWETRFEAIAIGQQGDPARGYAMVEALLADHPDDAEVHYDLACLAALQGHRDQALTHWRRALELNPKVREWAADDTDLDSIREDL